MSMIKPVTMYSIICDRCGKSFIMNWLISTQRTEAIIYLDKAIKELEE